MKQFLLLVLMIVCGAAALKLYAHRTAAQNRTGYQTLTAEEAKARLDQDGDLILLDVRTQTEYDQGHIPGAVCLPSEEIGQDMPVAFDKDAEILVYCRSGRRSAEAAGKLAELGYRNVADFGGILDWPYETTTE